jgi:hypothetical protein
MHARRAPPGTALILGLRAVGAFTPPNSLFTLVLLLGCSTPTAINVQVGHCMHPCHAQGPLRLSGLAGAAVKLAWLHSEGLTTCQERLLTVVVMEGQTRRDKSKPIG